MRAPRSITVVLLVGSVAAGGVVGATQAFGILTGQAGRPLPVAALSTAAPHPNPLTLPSSLSPDVRDLAEAANRWDSESSGAGVGEAVTSRAANLISAAGSRSDTLSAFPSENGAVCFEVRAAGTCNYMMARAASPGRC